MGRERITDVALGDHTEREVTVLFADIRGYTALAETMTPEETYQFVNAFNSRMGPVIRDHKGFINQYLGDAIMAIFPESPTDALQAAIHMQKIIHQYNQERIKRNRQVIAVGRGVHTGSLIMGIIGDQQRIDAATIADTVNTASRIESLTKHYGASILLSEDSMEKIGKRDTFHFRYLGKVQVKGKKEPVGLYECYNGDAPDVAVLKTKTQADFEKGLEQFLHQEFPEASATFNKVLKVNPDDHTAQLFLNKSSGYIVTAPPDDWDGVEVMTYK